MRARARLRSLVKGGKKLTRKRKLDRETCFTCFSLRLRKDFSRRRTSRGKCVPSAKFRKVVRGKRTNSISRFKYRCCSTCSPPPLLPLLFVKKSSMAELLEIRNFAALLSSPSTPHTHTHTPTSRLSFSLHLYTYTDNLRIRRQCNDADDDGFYRFATSGVTWHLVFTRDEKETAIIVFALF